MSSEARDLSDRLRRHLGDGCFACGRSNPIGLRIDGFEVSNDTVSAFFTPQPEHRGSPEILHGGITATLLDEILAWACILLRGTVAVTAQLDVRYSRPIRIDGSPLRLTSRIDDDRGRRIGVSGSIVEEDRTMAKGTGLYVAMTDLDHLLQSDPPAETI